ncbi:hypothetical protein FOCC_FOCC008090 [Frankliniella occidentalis]|nr:hypothetical protein FOCC_FOCC008090 [Frankliniella occidentalis]
MVECKKAQPKEVMLPANLAKTRAAGRGAYGEYSVEMDLPSLQPDFMWSLGALPEGFPAAAYAAYAAGRGYSGYPGFGLPYPTVDLTNGQLTPNNNTPLLTQALSGSIDSRCFHQWVPLSSVTIRCGDKGGGGFWRPARANGSKRSNDGNPSRGPEGSHARSMNKSR